MENPVFRASYSTLSVWASGDWERAVKYYFKLEKFITPAMEQGRRFHQEWEEHILAEKRLPTCFGGKTLKEPKAELFLKAQIYDWLELVGVIDCIDVPDIHEFKSGKQKSEAYVLEKQAGIYGVLATYNKFLVTRAFVHHYDQYTKQSDTSIVWLTDNVLNEAFNWVITLSAEMHDYFKTNGLYERYGAHLIKNSTKR